MKNKYYDTKPNSMQTKKISILAFLGYSLEEVEDRVLFDRVAENNPIVVEDVEEIYSSCKKNDFTNKKAKPLAKILNKREQIKYSSFCEFYVVPLLSEAQEIAKKLKCKVENIKW